MWIITIIYRLFMWCFVNHSFGQKIVPLFTFLVQNNFSISDNFLIVLLYFFFIFIMLNNRRKPDILLYWIVLHDHCFLFGLDIIRYSYMHMNRLHDMKRACLIQFIVVIVLLFNDIRKILRLILTPAIYGHNQIISIERIIYYLYVHNNDYDEQMKTLYLGWMQHDICWSKSMQRLKQRWNFNSKTRTDFPRLFSDSFRPLVISFY